MSSFCSAIIWDFAVLNVSGHLLGVDPLNEMEEEIYEAVSGETAEPVAATYESVVAEAVDYTPVIYEVGNGISGVMLFCAFLICGLLLAFKIMEVH